MAAETSTRSGSSSNSGGADSYIGSLISLTSKFEIRYEGVLYNINTEESSIGLRNVKSFGTEGRKKDGPQVPPNDKVYEYILFRGSDIKDLQVKSSPPVQTTTPIHNDPAIIQSHYSRPPPVSPSFPPGSGSIPDLTPHPTQMGQPRPTFQGGLPLYQPGGSIGSWGSAPPPPTGNGTGLAMPMYWQGFYGPANGVPPMQQQSLFRPPPGLSLPHSMQYPGFNPSLPNVPSNLVPSNIPPSSLPPSSNPVSNVPEMPSSLLAPVGSSSLSLTSSSLTPTFPSTLVNVHSATSASDTFPVLMPNRAPTTAVHTAALSSSPQLVSPLTTSSMDMNATVSPISSKPKTVASGSSVGHLNLPQSVSSIVGTSSSSHKEAYVPSLVTPGQLLQPSSAAALSSSHSSPPTRKDAKEVQAPLLSERPTTPPKELQAPLLPLPSSSGQKPNGTATQTRHSYHNNYHYRGRERGNGFSRPVTKFTEDFDFMAMNEKFKKDEVWGHLGKSSKAQSGDEEDDDGDYLNGEEDDGSAKVEATPVYVKDDFFDSLSCNAFDRGSRGGRTKFSEQIKIDTQTFGDFPRYRGGRGRGPGRGGRSRGPHYGRGYGYVGRGRGQGQSMPSRGN